MNFCATKTARNGDIVPVLSMMNLASCSRSSGAPSEQRSWMKRKEKEKSLSNSEGNIRLMSTGNEVAQLSLSDLTLPVH